MAEVVYFLCALTSMICAILLIRSYMRNKVHLLLWSSICFFGLMIANILLVVDLVVFQHHDLLLFRNLVTVTSLTLLLYGLLWEIH